MSKTLGPKPPTKVAGETTVEYGFVILDQRGNVWSDMLFADEDAANMTAARCVASAQDIRAARKVSYVDRTFSAPKDGHPKVQFLLEPLT